jgi:ketosteroid isomerase-like protein
MVSQQNVEIAKRGIDAFNQRDLDTYDELVTLDFEWFPAMPGALGGDSYRGREGVERFLEALDDTWEEMRLVGEEFRDLGNRVLLLARLEGRGKSSGVPVTQAQSIVIDL